MEQIRQEFKMGAIVGIEEFIASFSRVYQTGDYKFEKDEFTMKVTKDTTIGEMYKWFRIQSPHNNEFFDISIKQLTLLEEYKEK